MIGIQLKLVARVGCLIGCAFLIGCTQCGQDPLASAPEEIVQPSTVDELELDSSDQAAEMPSSPEENLESDDHVEIEVEGQ